MLPMIPSLAAYITRKIYPAANNIQEIIRHSQSAEIRPTVLPDVQVSPMGDDSLITPQDLIDQSLHDSTLGDSDLLEDLLRDHLSGNGVEIDQQDSLADLLKISLEADLISQEIVDVLIDAI